MATNRGFQIPKEDGKYNHPWLKELSPGKTRFYNLMQRSVVTALVGVSLYGAIEVCRGSFYILQANKARQEVSSLHDDDGMEYLHAGIT